MTTPTERLLSAVATLTDEVAGLKKDICDLKREVSETREIVEAWGAVKTAGKFLKWLAAALASIGVIVASIKFSILHIIGRYP